MKKRMLIIIGIATVALVATSVALAAGTLTATATVTGAGALALNTPGNTAIATTLDGSDQLASYSPVVGLVDARGTGNGWNLTMSATPFTDGQSHTLAPGTVTGATQGCHSGSTCTAATNADGLPDPALGHRGEGLQRDIEQRSRQGRRDADRPGRDPRQRVRRLLRLDGHRLGRRRPVTQSSIELRQGRLNHGAPFVSSDPR
jgi:hypothetical protein